MGNCRGDYDDTCECGCQERQSERSPVQCCVIKPCPFCGGESKLFYHEDFRSYRVECANDHCLDWWEDDEIDAIEVWNKRAL
jgi:hypothetical protein